MSRAERVILAPQRIADLIMGERFVGAAEIVKRFPQGKLDMKPIVVLEVVAAERLLHRKNIGIGKPHGLEVGQAPPDLARGGIYNGSLAVSGNRFVLPANGLEHVTVRQHRPRLVWSLGYDLFVKLQRLVKIAKAGERGCVQTKIAR